MNESFWKKLKQEKNLYSFLCTCRNKPKTMSTGLVKRKSFTDSFPLKFHKDAKTSQFFSSSLKGLKWGIVFYHCFHALCYEWDTDEYEYLYINSITLEQKDKTIPGWHTRLKTTDFPLHLEKNHILPFHSSIQAKFWGFDGTINISFTIFGFQENIMGVREHCLRSFQLGHFTDVCLCWSKGEIKREIPAHKIILRAGSSVFVEKYSEEAKIWDITLLCPDIEDTCLLYEMVHFLYSNTLSEQYSCQNWLDLYELSITFQIPTLSAICLDRAKRDLPLQTKKNLEKYMKVAAHYDLKELFSLVKIQLAKMKLEEMKEQL